MNKKRLAKVRWLCAPSMGAIGAATVNLKLAVDEYEKLVQIGRADLPRLPDEFTT